MTVNGTKSLSAYFNLPAGSSVKAGGSFFGTLSAAATAVSNGAEISVKSGDVYEVFDYNVPVASIIKGGYSIDFANIIGNTVIHGAINVINGSICIDGITIQ